MEACNFGHKKIVELLLAVPSLDLEAMNIRGQRADEVATSRGHDQLALMIQNKRTSRYVQGDPNQNLKYLLAIVLKMYLCSPSPRSAKEFFPKTEA